MRMIDISNGYKSITANKLRSSLTILLITLGICAMVCVRSSIAAIEWSLTETYKQMGSGVTHITGDYDNPITYLQAKQFSERYHSDREIAIFGSGTYNTPVRFGQKSTPPQCELCAVNENYLRIDKCKISFGRNFTSTESGQGSSCCIIGGAIAEQLFGEKIPIGQKIKISERRFEIIGILEKEQDNSQGSIDYRILIPWHNPIFHHDNSDIDFEIILENGREYAEVLFRKIRQLSPIEEKDYTIEKSELILKEYEENLDILNKGATIISIVTLLCAALGLMNIMLIQVEEKQRELGVRRSLGATKQDILNQILTESTMLSLIGSVMGIAIGIATAAAITGYLETPLQISWRTIFLAITICFLTGVSAGYFPAHKGADKPITDSLKAR